jgi:hypothetical protein
MPKAYWIAHVDVRDPERYKDYVATAGRPSRATAPSSWRAAAPTRRWRASGAAATW